MHNIAIKDSENNNNNTIITIKKPGWYLERWLVIIESERHEV